MTTICRSLTFFYLKNKKRKQLLKLFFFFTFLKILLREGCKKILVADSLSLLQKMHRTQMRGVRVNGECFFRAEALKLKTINTNMLFFSVLPEDSICESCHATILPSGETLYFYHFLCQNLIFKVILRLILCVFVFQRWPNPSVSLCFTADTCFTRNVYHHKEP